MLFIGMGTEAVVFFLAAFDRPFDRNEIGKELPHDFETDEEIERAEGLVDEEEDAEEEEDLTPDTDSATTPNLNVQLQPVSTAPTIETATAPTATNAPQAAIAAHYDTPEGAATVEREARQLSTIIRMANDELLRRAQAVLSPEMEAATQDYIAKLHTLNETLAKVDEQSAHLTRDAKEMENLNRTLIGINKVYDLHFASISRQVNTIEDINEQTRQLATKIEEVNAVYTRMIQTLSIMGNPTGTASAPAADPQHNPS